MAIQRNILSEQSYLRVHDDSEEVLIDAHEQARRRVCWPTLEQMSDMWDQQWREVRTKQQSAEILVKGVDDGDQANSGAGR